MARSDAHRDDDDDDNADGSSSSSSSATTTTTTVTTAAAAATTTNKSNTIISNKSTDDDEDDEDARRAGVEEAMELLRRAVGLAPSDADALCHYAHLLHVHRHDAEAAEALYWHVLRCDCLPPVKDCHLEWCSLCHRRTHFRLLALLDCTEGRRYDKDSDTIGCSWALERLGLITHPDEPCPVPPPRRWDTSRVLARVFADLGSAQGREGERGVGGSESQATKAGARNEGEGGGRTLVREEEAERVVRREGRREERREGDKESRRTKEKNTRGVALVEADAKTKTEMSEEEEEEEEGGGGGGGGPVRVSIVGESGIESMDDD